MSWQVLQGDCLNILPTLEPASVQTCVTSPPYWGLRNYGVDGQLGLESTPEEYVANLVSVFREVRRVLRDDGTVWLNLGDSYVSNAPGKAGRFGRGSDTPTLQREGIEGRVSNVQGLKPKDLCGIPWRVAFALQADGWWLRSDIIWSKPNPMPESVTDRPTRAHEYLFLLSKSARYFWDADAIREEHEHHRRDSWDRRYLAEANGDQTDARMGNNPAGRNRRSVWEIATQPYSDAHFATFPSKLVEPCILAGSHECTRVGCTGSHSVVLDPFAGAGTTGLVALRHNRSFIGIELNLEYAEMARNRIRDDAPLWNHGAEVV